MRQMPGTTKRFTPDKYTFTKGFPTRENCNLADPRETFLWMLAALPGVRGAQLVMPVAFNMVISEHLYECGARLGAEPTKKYQAPSANEPHWMTSPGKWVPVDAPEEKPNPVRELLGRMSSTAKAELLQALQEEQGSK